MTDARIKELLEICEKATPPEWTWADTMPFVVLARTALREALHALVEARKEMGEARKSLERRRNNV